MKSNKLNLNYNLRPKKKNDGTQLVNLSINLNGNRIIRGVGISVKKNNWDLKRQKIKPADPLASEKNFQLKNINNKLEKSYLMNNDQSLSDITNELDDILNPKHHNDKSILIENYKEFLTHSKEENVERTYKNKLYLLQLLKNYSSLKKIPLSYESIDINFLNGFIDYLKGLGKSHNTVRGHFKRLKAFLNFGLKYDLHDNNAHIRIQIGEVESKQLFLLEDDINNFFDVEISDSKLKEAQDVALFMYETLQRYSDVRDFEFSMIKSYTKGKKKYFYWDLKTNKTNDSIKVPLGPDVMDIVKKYKIMGMNRFPVPSNQVLNRRMKRIGELAGLDEIANSISSRLKNFDKKKWNQPRLFHYIGCHTFRRSGITNKLMKGISSDVVIKVSGHKDSKSFQKYVDLANSFISDKFLGE